MEVAIVAVVVGKANGNVRDVMVLDIARDVVVVHFAQVVMEMVIFNN